MIQWNVASRNQDSKENTLKEWNFVNKTKCFLKIPQFGKTETCSELSWRIFALTTYLPMWFCIHVSTIVPICQKHRSWLSLAILNLKMIKLSTHIFHFNYIHSSLVKLLIAFFLPSCEVSKIVLDFDPMANFVQDSSSSPLDGMPSLQKGEMDDMMG